MPSRRARSRAVLPPPSGDGASAQPVRGDGSRASLRRRSTRDGRPRRAKTRCRDAVSRFHVKQTHRRHREQRRRERSRHERRLAYRRRRRGYPAASIAGCSGVNATDCALPIVQPPRRRRSVLRAAGHRPRSGGRRAVTARRGRAPGGVSVCACTVRGRPLPRQARCGSCLVSLGTVVTPTPHIRVPTSPAIPVSASRRPRVARFPTAALAEVGDPLRTRCSTGARSYSSPRNRGARRGAGGVPRETSRPSVQAHESARPFTHQRHGAPPPVPRETMRSSIRHRSSLTLGPPSPGAALPR